jgi:GH24 family phage-related lysozyme (muramidase)
MARPLRLEFLGALYQVAFRGNAGRYFPRRWRPRGILDSLHSHIELKDETIKLMAITRLKEEFVPGLRQIFHGFDGYPNPAKQALVDMVYNLGVTGLKKFKKLIAAAEKGDWQEAANESHRASCREARNNWTRERFKKAAEEAA